VAVLNGVAEELTGWKAEDAVGRPLSAVFNIINEQTRQPAESPVDRVLREGVVVGLANHTVLVARDGTERPVADSGAPIRDSGGAAMVGRMAGLKSRISLPRACPAGSRRRFMYLARDRGFRTPMRYLPGFLGLFRRLNEDRGFRCRQQQPPQAPQKVGASCPELLLRRPPRQPRQRRRHPRRIDRLTGIALLALLGMPSDEVARVCLSPCRLIAPPQLTSALTAHRTCAGDRPTEGAARNPSCRSHIAAAVAEERTPPSPPPSARRRFTGLLLPSPPLPSAPVNGSRHRDQVDLAQTAAEEME